MISKNLLTLFKFTLKKKKTNKKGLHTRLLCHFQRTTEKLFCPLLSSSFLTVLPFFLPKLFLAQKPSTYYAGVHSILYSTAYGEATEEQEEQGKGSFNGRISQSGSSNGF